MANGSLLSVSYGEDKELDLESVNTALREFQQELTDAQRDRVYLKILITDYKFNDSNSDIIVMFFFHLNNGFAFLRMKPRLR